MDPILNPFAPGAGTAPPELTGRSELLHSAQVALERVRLGRPARSFMATGLRGVGKTVLLNHVYRMADASAYKAIHVEAVAGRSLPTLLLPALKRTLLELDRLGQVNEAVKRGLRVLRSFVSAVKLNVGEAELGIDIDPERGVADSGELEADLTALFVALGNAARAREKAVAIFIDEVQYLARPDMSALIMALHRVSQLGLPITMFAAGLPHLLGVSGDTKTYAERLFDFTSIGALSYDDVIQAVDLPAQKQEISFTPQALQEIYQVTEGYPYFVQEWAYHSWNAAPRSPITQDDVVTAQKTVLARLDAGFFRVRFDRMTPRERAYLRTMAELGPGNHRSGEIANRMNADVRSLGPLRNILISKGMIYSPAYGENAFTVPLFDAYLRRAMPEFKA
ncbi:MAG: ATP-binding protein [Acetobacteraceae bacterium]|nr:ATP-binding protein [Acetobacteraceae bacterium]